MMEAGTWETGGPTENPGSVPVNWVALSKSPNVSELYVLPYKMEIMVGPPRISVRIKQ